MLSNFFNVSHGQCAYGGGGYWYSKAQHFSKKNGENINIWK